MDIKMGFGAIPKAQYVFVNREGDACWYSLSEEGRQVPIYEKALTGLITGIECNKSVETQYGVDYKTDLAISAPTPYIIRSGRESYFSKSLLLSIDALTVEQLRHPVTITVSPGDRTVVFCSIYDPATYRVVDISWGGHKDIDLQALEQRVSSKIEAIASQTQTAPSESLPQISGSKNTEIRTMMMAQIDKYLAQLNWTPEMGRKYLQQNYAKTSRRQLNDTELLDFTFRVIEMAGVQTALSIAS
jgi:hypothetical protein